MLLLEAFKTSIINLIREINNRRNSMMNNLRSGIYIITTTIYVPTVLERYRQLAIQEGVNLKGIIVAGDLKTPKETEEFLARDPIYTYLTPNQQGKRKCSESLGWNRIMRRNIALLEAIERCDLDNDIIISIDDDNYPIDETYFLTFILTLTQPFRGLYYEDSEWFNIGNLFEPQFFHRGFPHRFDDRKEPYKFSYRDLEANDNKVGIAAGLWIGDPDIDAIERIMLSPCIKTIPDLVKSGIVIKPGCFAPTNSQNTAFPAILAPIMAVWPWVGRYDDIWASYLAQKIMWDLGYLVHYGPPFCLQNRNPHNLLLNLKDEIDGLEHTVELVTTIDSIVFKDVPNRTANNAFNRFAYAIDQLFHPMISKEYSERSDIYKLFGFLDNWISEVGKIINGKLPI